jgi:aminopeptidase N
LLDDKDPHFKIDVVSALATLGDAKSRGAMRRALERELDGRVLRRLREALRDMSDSPGQEKKRLNEELETVKDELTELKNRLAKLEGRKAENGKEKEPKPAPAKTAPPAAARRPSKAKPPARKKAPAKKAGPARKKSSKGKR